MPEIDFLNKKTFTKTPSMINLRKRATIKCHSYRLKGRDFVHQGKIEIDVNERAVFIRTQGCFSFTPTPIVSLTVCRCKYIVIMV